MFKIIIKTEKLSVNDESELFHNFFKRSPEDNLFYQTFYEIDEVEETINWLMTEFNTIRFEVICENETEEGGEKE